MRANILGVHRLSAARGATLLVIHHHFGEQNVGTSSRWFVNCPGGVPLLKMANYGRHFVDVLRGMCLLKKMASTAMLPYLLTITTLPLLLYCIIIIIINDITH